MKRSEARLKQLIDTESPIKMRGRMEVDTTIGKFLDRGVCTRFGQLKEIMSWIKLERWRQWRANFDVDETVNRDSSSHPAEKMILVGWNNGSRGASNLPRISAWEWNKICQLFYQSDKSLQIFIDMCKTCLCAVSAWTDRAADSGIKAWRSER